MRKQFARFHFFKWSYWFFRIYLYDFFQFFFHIYENTVFEKKIQALIAHVSWITQMFICDIKLRDKNISKIRNVMFTYEHFKKFENVVKK